MDLQDCWWPQCLRKTLCDLPVRQRGLLPAGCTHPPHQGKARAPGTCCMRGQESKDQRPAALSMRCSSFKDRFKKHTTAATFHSRSAAHGTCYALTKHTEGQSSVPGESPQTAHCVVRLELRSHSHSCCSWKP